MTTSRLRLAWMALGLAVAAFAVAALLAPEPQTAAEPLEITLPAAPDRFARGSGAGAAAADSAEASDQTPALPQVILGDDGGDSGGEVVITVGEAAPVAAAKRQGPAVPPAAYDEAMTTETPTGRRPALSAEGRTPFTAYRRLEPVGDAKGVAVVVSGLGLDADLTRRAMRLPPAVSLAFAPYAKDLPTQIEQARKAGHEVLIEIPMGTPGVAPAALGPAGLLSERTPRANTERLSWILSRAPAYPMVTNYLGRGFAGDEAAMGRVMRLISETGTAYVDDTGLARQAARAAGVPYAATDILIEPDTADVADRLDALTRRPAKGEVALAKVYATTASLGTLDRWARSLPEGVKLVPASTAVSSR